MKSAQLEQTPLVSWAFPSMSSEVKTFRAVLAGTGYEGRADVIRRMGRKGSKLRLVREPANKHDANAIRVDLECRFLFGLLKLYRHIGYIQAARAARLAPKIDGGAIRLLDASIVNLYAPPEQYFPDVTIEVNYEGKSA